MWSFVLGIISFGFISLNLLLWASLLHLVALLRVWPSRRIRARTASWIRRCFENWSACNDWWFCSCLGVRWHFDKPLERNFSEWHLVVANHQSWVDVFAVLAQIRGRLPMPKIFMKQELAWLPLAGTATWIMGFPFMKRYSADTLKRHPELVGKDLETTRRSCARFVKYPNTVLSFVEGTRYSSEKKSDKKFRRQESPYRHLLKPKAGGLSFVLNAMPGKFSGVVDMTIIYPHHQNSFWDLLCGRLKEVHVITRWVPFSNEMLETDFDPVGKDAESFRNWLNQIWLEKDERLERALTERRSDTVKE